MDRIFMRGLVAGIMAGLAGFIFSHTMYILGLSKLSSIHLTGALELENIAEVTMGGFVLALIVHLILSGIFGLSLSVLINFMGSGFWLLKGAVAGAFGDMLLHNFLLALIRPDLNLDPNAATSATLLATHILMGIVAAFIVVYYSRLRIKAT
jgi:hypothetical protein